ncbi:hypothetical protein [Paraburkholderia sp. RL17-337-BIB-A]|uniref:hypothetical protein n=1 Tax=Paraburkholderia sp. RL17-337-BIB-A TaxID=3031636 RepID=UPI0038B9C3A8
MEPIIGVETYGVLTRRGENGSSIVRGEFLSKIVNVALNLSNVMLNYLNMVATKAWLLVRLG